MSRGLGRIQREILETMDEALLRYLGPNSYTVYRGCMIRLAPGVYDLHASALFLTERRGLRFHEGPFQASMSRAVNGLVQRGLLIPLRLVPITRCWNKPQRFRKLGHDLIREHNGELFMEHSAWQVRFVTGPRCYMWSKRLRAHYCCVEDDYFGLD